MLAISSDKKGTPCKKTVGVGAVRTTVSVLVVKADVTRIVVTVPVIVTTGAVVRISVNWASPFGSAVHSAGAGRQFLGHFWHFRTVVAVVVIVLDGVQKSYH